MSDTDRTQPSYSRLDQLTDRMEHIESKVDAGLSFVQHSHLSSLIVAGVILGAIWLGAAIF